MKYLFKPPLKAYGLILALSFSLSACGLSAPPSGLTTQPGAEPSTEPTAAPEDGITRSSSIFDLIGPKIEAFNTDGVPENTLLLLGSNFESDAGTYDEKGLYTSDDSLQVFSVLLDDEPLDFVINSDSLITATLPDGATSGTVTVSVLFFGSHSLSFDATPEPTAAPVVGSLSSRVGSVGDSFVLFGENLLETTGVTLGGVAANFTVIDDNSLSVTVPNNAVNGPVTVTHAGGSDSTSYDYILAEVTRLNPSAALIGETVTLTGSGFSQLNALSVGGGEPNYSVVSDTQITLTVPGAADTGNVVLTFTNGGSLNAGTLTVNNQGFFVKANASGSNDGSNWDNAYTNLQSALSAAGSGDEIWVAAGIHTPPDASQSFTMVDGVSIYAGFDGSEKDRDERNWQSNATILSCDIAGDDNYSDGSTADLADNCATVIKGADNAVLDGFTIQGGNSTQQGGGMMNYNVSPTLQNLTFAYNVAQYGGGLYNYFSASPTLSNVSFVSNSAQFGGGMYNNDNASPTLDDVSFSSNFASRHGGGMYNQNSASPTLNTVSFTGNSAGNYGGGMYLNSNADAILNDVEFSANTATDFGGGLYIFSSAPQLNRVVIASNTADRGGGLYIKEDASPVVNNAVVVYNSANSRGGGLYYENASATLNYVSFFSNTAQFGAGAYNNGNFSGPTLQNCLFWSNDLTNITLDITAGNLEASSDPFVNSSSPIGADNQWFTSDDGLQLQAGSEAVGVGVGGSNLPSTDILNLTRTTPLDSGAYALTNSNE